jgi:hypothetical protein
MERGFLILQTGVIDIDGYKEEAENHYDLGDKYYFGFPASLIEIFETFPSVKTVNYLDLARRK